jgi:hypothetical protein
LVDTTTALKTEAKVTMKKTNTGIDLTKNMPLIYNLFKIVSSRSLISYNTATMKKTTTLIELAKNMLLI